MRCSGCGKELKPTTKSCPNCGRLVTMRARFSSKSSESYSDVMHQQGRVIVDQDYSEEVKIVTERRKMTKDSQAAKSTDNHNIIKIIDDSAVIDSDRIRFSMTSGIIPLGDFALSFNEPEEGIFATTIGSEISPDTSRFLVYLEAWEDTVSGIEDSDLMTADIEGSDTSKQYNVGFRLVPATEKMVTREDLTDFIESQRKNHRSRHFVPLAVLEVTKEGPIKITHYVHESVDVLKPHSIIGVKGLGSKMDGSYYVPVVDHKIGTSGESESSQTIQCEYCGTENDKSDKFCRNCGSSIIS